MSRKKHNNVTSIEIDYDKLADAIIRAQNRVLEKEIQEKTESSNISIRDIVIALWSIWTGKKDTKGQLTTGLFAMLGCVFLKCIAVMLICVCISIIGQIIKIGLTINLAAGFLTNILIVLQMAIYLVIFIAVTIFATFVWGASRELENERDKNYVISIFSVLVAFLAIIVSLNI